MKSKSMFIVSAVATALTVGVASFANIDKVGAIFAKNEPIPYGCGDIVYGQNRYSNSGSATSISTFQQSNSNIVVSSVTTDKAYSGNKNGDYSYALKVGTNASVGSITYNFETPMVITKVMIYACPFTAAKTSEFTVSTDGHGEDKWTQTAASYATSADFNANVLYESDSFFASDKKASSSLTLATTGTSSNALNVYKIVLRVQEEVEEEEPGYDLMVQVNEILANMYCDSIYIKYGDWDCLIDGGDRGDKDTVSLALRTYCTDHKLDLYIGSHAHSDHMGIFAYATASDNVFVDGGITSFGYLIDNGSARSVSFLNYYIENVRPWMIEHGATYLPAHAIFNNDSGFEYAYGKNVINITGDVEGTSSLSNSASGDVYLTVLNTNHYLVPGSTSDDEPNLASVGVCLSAFNQRYIMCGDAEGETEQGIMANHSDAHGNPALWNSDNDVYLKANHHGSNTKGSNSQDWIDWVDPDHVFVSAAILKDTGNSRDNTTSAGVTAVQHPYPAAIQRFETKTYDIRWNGINGTYRWTSTNKGENVTFQGSEKIVPYYYEGEAVTGEENITLPNSKWCLNSIYASCASPSSKAAKAFLSASPLGSFVNVNPDLEYMIEKNRHIAKEVTNEHGELFDHTNGTYC